MKNPIRTSTAIKSLANYLPPPDGQTVASSYSPDREIRRRKIHAVREALDSLSASARESNLTFYQFQQVLSKFQEIGINPPDDIVEDITTNLFER